RAEPLLPPLRVRPSAIARIELPAEPAPAERFWAALAPRLGWRVVSAGEGWEVETPGLAFRYVGGPGARATLVLEARAGAATVAGEVRAAGGELLSEVPVVFRDPVGTHIRIGT